MRADSCFLVATLTESSRTSCSSVSSAMYSSQPKLCSAVVVLDIAVFVSRPRQALLGLNQSLLVSVLNETETNIVIVCSQTSDNSNLAKVASNLWGG